MELWQVVGRQEWLSVPFVCLQRAAVFEWFVICKHEKRVIFTFGNIRTVRIFAVSNVNHYLRSTILIKR